jgi:Phytanoyl-CoA dioxygenase (PhyH)
MKRPATDASVVTDDMRLLWETNGYFTIHDALPGDVCDDLYSRVLTEWREALAKKERDPRLSEKKFVMDAVVFHDAAFSALIDRSPAIDAVMALMGDNIRLLASTAMVRPPVTFDQREWHVDGPYPEQYPETQGGAPLLELNVIYALHDVGPTGGCFTVVPGTHRLAARPTDQFSDDTNDLAGAVPISQRKGDATFFHNALWHTAGNNGAEQPRVNLFYTYCYTWMQPYDYAPEELDPGQLKRLTPVARRLVEGPSGKLPSRYWDGAGGLRSLLRVSHEKGAALT